MTLIFPLASLRENQGISSGFSSQRNLGKARLIAITRFFLSLKYANMDCEFPDQVSRPVYLIPFSLSGVFYEMLWEMMV